MKSLIIVESPAKAKKITQLLGNSNYKVIASFGHIRNLSKKNMGVDIENGFEPIYENLPIRSKQIKEIKEEAKKCDRVILAGDADREGEAICWHILKLLKLPMDTQRIVFHEITKSALENAIANPEAINMDLVNSQQARRIIDRLVGFEISPILWKHIQANLSAGRVQSASLKLICDRENDIEKYNAEKYYRTTGAFNKGEIVSNLNTKFKKESDVQKFLEDCGKAVFAIGEVKKGGKIKKPASPYTTSSLLQDAGGKLSMSSKQIMNSAQRLYESGKITYHRTDSVNLSEQILKAIKEFVTSTYGQKYSKPTKYKTNIKCAQEAHEAIRPVNVTEIELQGEFSAHESKLYGLIWRRTIASQMAYAEYDTLNIAINISNRKELFNAYSENIVFDGFLRVYNFEKQKDDNEEDEQEVSKYEILKKLKKGDALKYHNITSEEKYTSGTGRYNEAGLIKVMKDTGIGRPSTYASILNTLVERKYVVKETRTGDKKKIKIFTLKGGSISNKEKEITLNKERSKLFPTEIGRITNKFLEKNFEKILESGYTSKMENNLDEIANGKSEWKKTIKKFYDEFHPSVDSMKKIEKNDSEKKKHERVLGTDPKSGKTICARIAKFGPVVQIGEKGDKNIKYASIEGGLSIDKITLEQAIDLLQYPKELGEYQGEMITIKKGKFGPFISWGSSKTFSLGDLEIDSVNRQIAIEILSTESPGMKKNYNTNKFKKPRVKKI